MHYAAFYDKKEMVEILIENGANVNATSNDLRIPLHRALVSTSYECILQLLQHGALMTAKDKDRLTPIEMSLMKHMIDPFKTMNFFTHLSD